MKFYRYKRVITEFDTTVSENVESLIGPLTLEMKLTVKTQQGESARWVYRGRSWERAFEYRARLRPNRRKAMVNKFPHVKRWYWGKFFCQEVTFMLPLGISKK